MYKRVSRSKGTGSTQYDMVYTQAYIDFGQRKTARQLKFIDESGFKVTCGDRNYGHSKQGGTMHRNWPESCWQKFAFKFVVWCDFVLYFNFVDGSSNTAFTLLLARVIILSGRLPTTSIFPGDVVIVDNCAIPQKRVERTDSTQFFG